MTKNLLNVENILCAIILMGSFPVPECLESDFMQPRIFKFPTEVVAHSLIAPSESVKVLGAENSFVCMREGH